MTCTATDGTEFWAALHCGIGRTDQSPRRKGPHSPDAGPMDTWGGTKARPEVPLKAFLIDGAPYRRTSFLEALGAPLHWSLLTREWRPRLGVSGLNAPTLASAPWIGLFRTGTAASGRWRAA